MAHEDEICSTVTCHIANNRLAGLKLAWLTTRKETALKHLETDGGQQSSTVTHAQHIEHLLSRIEHHEVSHRVAIEITEC